jgi:hypothetical protein
MATTRRLRRAVLCSVAGAALVLSACKGGESKTPAAAAASDAPKAARNATSAAASTPVTRTTPAEPSPPGGPPRLPAVTRALPAAHTVAVVGLEGLDWAFRTLNTARKHALNQLPPPVRAQVPELIANEGKLVELLSFPPDTPSGWQTAGINPGPGVTLAFDDRVSAVAPLPLVYLGVRDRGVLMNWLVGVDRRRGGAGHAQATGAAKSSSWPTSAAASGLAAATRCSCPCPRASRPRWSRPFRARFRPTSTTPVRCWPTMPTFWPPSAATPAGS